MKRARHRRRHQHMTGLPLPQPHGRKRLCTQAIAVVTDPRHQRIFGATPEHRLCGIRMHLPLTVVRIHATAHMHSHASLRGVRSIPPVDPNAPPATVRHKSMDKRHTLPSLALRQLTHYTRDIHDHRIIRCHTVPPYERSLQTAANDHTPRHPAESPPFAESDTNPMFAEHCTSTNHSLTLSLARPGTPVPGLPAPTGVPARRRRSPCRRNPTPARTPRTAPLRPRPPRTTSQPAPTPNPQLIGRTTSPGPCGPRPPSP